MTEFPTSKKPKKNPHHDGPVDKFPRRQSTAGWFSRLGPRGQKKVLLAALACLVGVIFIVVLAVNLFSAGAKPAISASSLPNSAVSQPEADKTYDKDAEKLDTDQLGTTILAETEDAGQDYIDETLFIGDSNTARMMSYGFTSLDNDIGTVSMGIQHVLTKKCAFFKGYENGVTIPDAVTLMQPRRIIITFGTNNTVGWSADTFITSYKEALAAIHEAYPYADIIINSVPPVHQYRDNPNVTMQTIDSFNKALANLAQELGYKFLNSAEVLKDESTGYAKWDYTVSDGIHMNKDAMTALFDYIRTHAYITDDTRPALKAVPARLEAPYEIITSDPLAVHAEKTETTSSSTASADYTVTYTVADMSMGGIAGTLTQHLSLGQTATAVIAVPNPGYVFDHWAVNVGTLDPSDPQVVFTLTLPQEKNIVITAYFAEKPEPTPSPTPDHTHQWDAGTVTTAPSCTAEGLRTYTCTVCGQTYTEAIPMVDHTWTQIDRVEPTCTAEGHASYVCSVCGKSFTEPIPVVAHSWVVSADGTSQTCAVCGATEQLVVASTPQPATPPTEEPVAPEQSAAIESPAAP